MSTEQTVNAGSIEQTKQQIRGLVSEIAQLSKSNLDADEYYQSLLQRIVQALAAIGGAVWVLRDGQRLDLAYQIKMSQPLLDADSEAASRHFGLLNQIAGSGEPALIPPQSGTSEDGAAGNPTDSLLVLAPLRSDEQVEGVVEIFQRPDAQPVTQRGYLKFVVQMCELASEWFKSRKLRQISDRHSLWAEADHFSRMVHENLDLRETCYTVVNEGRKMIGCDRVSIAVMRGRQCKIEAVSGQDAIENRSNVANFLGQLATRVVATGESLWYDGSTIDMPPQVETALDRYIDESHTRMMVVLPVRRPKRPQDVRETVTGEADDESNEGNEIVGALIVEQIESSLPDEMIRSRSDLVYEHTARALTNCLDHNNIFLMPLWRAVGRMGWIVRGRTLPKTVAISTAVLVLLGILFLARKDFNMESEGALQPVVKQDIFVPIDGIVEEVLVEDQDEVQEGDLLVRLRDTDLEVQFEDIVGQRDAKKERLFSVETALLKQRNLTEVERIRLSGEASELRQELRTLDKQYELLKKKYDMLEIRSPIAGQVMMAWDVEQTLMRRPVTTGQVVMTVVDPNAEWELELYMRESRAGYVREAFDDADLREKDEEVASRVSYILATDPGTYRYGTLQEIKGGVEVDQERGPFVRMKVDIKQSDIGNPHPGATVTADVYCGRRSVAYALFHEAYEWVLSNIVFYLS